MLERESESRTETGKVPSRAAGPGTPPTETLLRDGAQVDQEQKRPGTQEMRDPTREGDRGDFLDGREETSVMGRYQDGQGDGRAGSSRGHVLQEE